MNRTEARELCMQMLFQMEAQLDFSEEAMQSFVEHYNEDGDQLDYIKSIYEAYASNADAVDELIEGASKGWKLERLAKVDLAVLRLGIAEIKFKDGEKVPVSAAINEAVKLAKKFGGDNSGKFVNGVLGSIVRE